MHLLLQQHSEFVCSGWIRAQLYQIQDYPGALLSKDARDKVHGELYRLTTPSVLAQLDDYEACSAAFPEPHEYQRMQVDVTINSAKHVTAWAYIYNYSVNPHSRILSGRFS